MIIESASPDETARLAAHHARELAPGDVVLVSGELGAGKTTWVRAACRELGVEEPVTSPTFTIGQLYGGRDGLEIAHLDLYRLDGLEGETPGLLDDYVTAERIVFVEWPERARAPFAHVRAHVRLEHRGGDRRGIEVA